uniref:type ISP restriction/modification enzyme n=1 Tax=Rhodoferax sp. OV413 TaxID=1855285 RepID=UPI0025D7B791
PEEINLKAEHVVKVNSIKQLRPLVSGQPWGIFFVEFNKGRLPITALRRVLNGLVPKGRAASGGHQTWAAHDLLFVSSFGESNAREIALAHFTDESAKGDLPTLRVLGWDDDDTPMQLGYVAQTLRDKLRWPANTRTADDLAKWRKQWAGAFALGYRQEINDAKTLALAMAELAKRIRRRVNTVLALESDKGHLRQMHKAFKDNLIADLSDDGFADMFAQTITYGLFTARASRSSGALVADDISAMVPSTNPFLKELLADFLNAAGRDRKKSKRVDFDELGINEVVTVLREVPMDAVLRSFNASKPGDDPVIHFYEDFLKAYDKAMRAKRGVFYTPSPVVQFIVRSVDEILKTEFGIEDGLASTITWGEMMARKPELKLPKFCTAATPFVQVLDPATGTGTFIVEVITQIHAHMLAKWAKQGKVTKAQWQPLWVEYVKQHLLPRLYAFELMMAPYAIAHMKIGLKLAETGYTFPEDGPRVNVFLTNALEPAHAINPGLAFEAPMLAHEAAAANRVKEQLAATVVVGNPPYSGVSNNMFPWIDGLLKGQLPDGTVVRSYYQVDGKPLGEKKLWLQDDYVKFIRFGQWRVECAGVGVLGYVTNHGYLDNPTFRGMRQCLTSTFPTITVVDLHGNAKKKEVAIDGGKDENVFDIEQGVAVGLMRTTAAQNTLLRHKDLFGARSEKYEQLLQGLTAVALPLTGPLYFFSPKDDSFSDEYAKAWPLVQVQPVNTPGIVTARDHLAINFDQAALEAKISEFVDGRYSDDQIRESMFKGMGSDKYPDGDSRGWKLPAARKALKGKQWRADITDIFYRPFDTRKILYRSDVVDWPRSDVMSQMSKGKNIALSVCKQLAALPWEHVLLTDAVQDDSYVSNRTKERTYMFPVWGSSGTNRTANFSQSFLDALKSVLGLTPAEYRPEDLTAALHAEKIFHYLYAVLHSPAYRQRYAAFLRTDFPRIPIPGSRKVFDALAKLGAELVAWHLLEHQDAINIVAGCTRSPRATAWFGTDFSLIKVAEKSRELAEVQGTADKVGKVFINATSGFANVHQSIWQHTIGAYQVLHKWLYDRHKAGRSLSQDDITHWLRVYAALQATQKLMLQVDVAIEANGGWPGAFSQNHPPPDAATLAAEQMVQKEQLKAQKKAATATKKRASYASPTGASSLFDDLEDMAGAAGGPDRPKSRATPAKAAGGKASGSAAQMRSLNDGQVMCAIRRVLASAGSGGLSRDDLIRSTARELGYARTSPALKIKLDTAIRRAVRRGIAENSGGVLTVLVKDIDGYDRDHLKAQLLAAIRETGGTCAKSKAPMLLARALGFARTGAGIAAVVESLLRSMVRTKQVESRAGQIQVVRAGVAV